MCKKKERERVEIRKEDEGRQDGRKKECEKKGKEKGK